MSVLRRGPFARPASSGGSASTIILSDTSPYGSRRLVIETDGVTTVAYLRDVQDTVVGAVWIANHQAAPAELDPARLEAGAPPAMPAGRTSRPEGRGPLDPSALEVVWFEEGDGAAVLESGELLCVIPVWSDMNRGIPGYSRDTTGQTPFAFPLGEELEEFAGRVEQSREHWRRHATEQSWADFQSGVLGHLLNRLGPGGHYWHDVGRGSRAGTGGGSGSGPGTGGAGGTAHRGARGPVVGVSERPARDDRPYTVLSTVGMSAQRMPTVELYEDEVSHHARIELAVATTLPAQRAGGVFPWLAQHPWRSITWFAPGDVVKWYDDSSTFPLGSVWDGVLLLDDPRRLDGPPAPDLSGFTFGGDPVRWLWLVPITEEERRFAREEGSNALIRRLAKKGRSWVVES